ncbi:MAG: ornithine cyclodeaminase family protein [Candidatus Bipolaricaulia bacterium]
MKLLILSRVDLEKALPMEEAVAALEEAFRLYHEGKAAVPLRLPLETPRGVVLYMPAFLRDFRGAGALGGKVVSVYPGNPQQSLPLIHALVLLNDPATGRPLALMEGAYLTGVRTGAASAVAAKYLARPQVKCLGLIGCGFQAFFQVQALCVVRPIERVVLFNRDPARAWDLKHRLEAELGLSAEVVEEVSALTRQAEVLITATTSKEPVFSGEEVQPGTTAIAIGAFTPDARETDDVLVRRARIYVDAYEGALAEAGDLLIPMERSVLQREGIQGELGELVTGKVPGRQHEDEIVLFKSVGLAIEDAAAAAAAYQNALKQGLGTEVELDDR